MWGLRRRTRLKRERLRTYKAQNLRFGSNIEAIKNEITEVEQIFCLTSVIFLLFLLPHLIFTEVGQVLRSASVSFACFSCFLTCLLPKYSRFRALLRYYYLAFPASSPAIYRSRAGFALCFGIACLLFLLPHLSFTEVGQVSDSASVMRQGPPISEAVLFPRQK